MAVQSISVYGDFRGYVAVSASVPYLTFDFPSLAACGFSSRGAHLRYFGAQQLSGDVCGDPGKCV